MTPPQSNDGAKFTAGKATPAKRLPVTMKAYNRRLVSVPTGTDVAQYEQANSVIVLSAKDYGTHYEFWII